MKSTKKAKTIKTLGVLSIPTLFAAGLLLSSSACLANAASVSGFRADYDSFTATEEAAADLNLELASEGTVLLKNKDNALPLQTSSTKKAAVTVLGTQADTLATGGSGSGGQNKPGGDTTPAKPNTLFDSLDAANISYNPSVKAIYEDPKNDPKALSNGNPYDGGHYMQKVKSATATSVEFGGSYYEKITDGTGTLDDASLTGYTDAAIIVISRTGAEGNDNLTCNLPNMDDPTDHYLQLDSGEKELVAYAKANFKKVIVILNSPAAMELGDLEDDDAISAVVWIGQPGWNGIMALGKILNGEINPSGRTVDFYMRDFETDPTWYNLGNYTQSNLIINGSATGNKVTTGSSVEMGYDEAYNLEGITNGNYKVVDYAEGIYVGYRYYETVYAELVNQVSKDAADTWYNHATVYPFGYGLSYTTFTQEISSISTSSLSKDSTVTVKVKVTNTGNVAGKDVVQLYNTAPYTEEEIEKSAVTLVGFEKTKLINPGETDEVSITIDAKDLASFDYNDANYNDFCGYELEKGSYTLSVRNNSHDVLDEETVTVGEDYTWDEDGNPDTPNNILSQEDNAWEANNTLSHNWTKDHTDNYLKRYQLIDGGSVALEEEYSLGSPNALQSQLAWILADDGRYNVFTKEAFLALNSQEPKEAYSDFDNVLTKEFETDYVNVWTKTNADIPDDWTQNTGVADASGLYAIELADMTGISKDDPKWTEFMNQLTWEELVKIVQDGGYGSAAMDTIGKPAIEDHDGPGQLRAEATVTEDGNGYAWVCESVIGSTWNKDLANKQGKIVGNESIFLGVTGWYGPGANLHRNPLSGRNFEYYSQDGVQGGLMLAAVVNGAQSKGVHVYMKHAFLNEQETSRSGIATFATEQAIREIYAKTFELAVREANANGYMSSFNRIGLSSSVSYAITQQMYVNEWKFNGIGVTDAYYSGCGWDSETMVRGGTLPLNSVFAVFPPATAIEGTWDSSLRNGKGGVTISNKDGSQVESATQYYYARTTAQNALYTYANSNALNGLSSKKMLSAKTLSFTKGKMLKDYEVYSPAELTAFKQNMREIYGSDTAYELKATNLPDGLSFDVSKGTLSGAMPTTPGHYTFNISVVGKDSLNYISKTITVNLNVVQPVSSGETLSVDFKKAVTLVEGDNYIPGGDVQENEGKYLSCEYSAEGLPEGFTIDPTTGVISGTFTNQNEGGKYYPITITQTCKYSEPWGFMPGAVEKTKVLTTTVYLYNTDPVGIVDISQTPTEDGNGTIVTITLTSGETQKFVITNGTNGTNGADGSDGTNGTNGTNGVDGVGIASVAKGENGSLIITLTDGTVKTIEGFVTTTTDTTSLTIAIISLVIAIAAVGAATFVIVKKRKND